jgi:hypothetical protein
MKTFDSSEMIVYISQGFSFSFATNGIITVNHKNLFPAYVYCGKDIEHAFLACVAYLEGE